MEEKTGNIDDIILIGPTGVGKTTISRLLAQALEMPLISLDQIRFRYYHEIGYNEQEAERLRQHDFQGLIRYWQPFDAHTVVRVLAEHHGGVFDFGAIHSVYEDPTLFQEVAQALCPYPNVVLLVPSSDPDESVRILHERGARSSALDQHTLEMWHRIIERFVNHPSNWRLAKHTVYTMGRTPAETLADILQVL